MSRNHKTLERSWTTIDTVLLDGEPYLLQEEVELHLYKTAMKDGGRTLEAFPTDNIRLVKLTDKIPIHNKEEIAKELNP